MGEGARNLELKEGSRALESPPRASHHKCMAPPKCVVGLDVSKGPALPSAPPWIPGPQLARGQTWAQCWEPATSWMSFRGGWPGAPTQIRALNLPAGREPGGNET